ncbi:HAMP domain-containing histidine kinase [Bdellovibrio bacteriovorus]|uniref:HAMP domain-containing sensor histidine kinase n=1 Tax=Bdellovibrio bacteriovorus TaxID=959 RepID=UPI0021D2008C|nr:HAMP domain-containing sensor histidine kinase [Bdellovibrio bacteriovorus]UXR63946.1 HAMP domain-containing histidine kinase [Bdellovibrio bacteriovorus]
MSSKAQSGGPRNLNDKADFSSDIVNGRQYHERMISFSQMKFSRKIFVALFGTGAGAAIIICLILNSTLSNFRISEFEDSYVDHMNLLAKALSRVEESQARIASNAGQFLQIQHAQGQLTLLKIHDMTRNLGVSRITLYDRTGSQVLMTSAGKPGSLSVDFPNQSFESVYQSALVRGEDGQVGQHTIMPSLDKRNLIEVVIYFDDVTQLLREMAEHDEDNLSIELVGIKGESLGHIQKPGFVRAWDLSEGLKWKEGVHWFDDKMVVMTSVKNDNLRHYRLLTTVSARALNAELHKMQITLLILAAVLIVLSGWLSAILTKTLLRKVEAIRGLLNQISVTQDYSHRVDVTANSQDELNDLGQNLNNMLATLQSHQARLIESERDKARTQVAAQVAHDIRSPLMSMNMALAQIETSQQEPLAILKSAIARVAGIVQKLSASTVKADEEPATEAPKLTLMEPLILSVYNEHRVRKLDSQKISYQGISMTPHLWSVVQVIELQTAFSNMINNAFEAGATEVSLLLTEAPKKWTLEIKDNGQGIPTEIIERIFERSFTSGKKTGTGLGLFQAKAAVEWCGGSLTVQSIPGQGTSFIVEIPREKPPAWLCTSLELAQGQTIAFVDDDLNILKTWQEKSQALGLSGAVFFDSVKKFEMYRQQNPWSEEAILVIDQNLGDSKKGLDVIREMALEQRAILCTTDFDEKWIQDQVRQNKARLIPKLLVSPFELKIRNS